MWFKDVCSKHELQYACGSFFVLTWKDTYSTLEGKGPSCWPSLKWPEFSKKHQEQWMGLSSLNQEQWSPSLEESYTGEGYLTQRRQVGEDEEGSQDWGFK